LSLHIVSVEPGGSHPLLPARTPEASAAIYLLVLLKTPKATNGGDTLVCQLLMLTAAEASESAKLPSPQQIISSWNLGAPLLGVDCRGLDIAVQWKQ
jgi:hypothetical protein